MLLNFLIPHPVQQLEQDIKAALSAAIQQVFGAAVAAEQLVIQPTRKEFAGTFTLVTFSLTKSLGKGPEQIGQALGEWLATNETRVSGFNVVKGFLNLEIGDSEWLSQFADMLARPDNAPVVN